MSLILSEPDLRIPETPEQPPRGPLNFTEPGSGYGGDIPGVQQGRRFRVAYVMEQGTLAGGHKLIYEHLSRLTDRGHFTKLFLVYPADTSWFSNLRVSEVEVCGDYANLTNRLVAFDGKKVATWWKTAGPVAASGGEGYYYIQDVETSYSLGPIENQQVLSTYQFPLKKYTESGWVQAELRRMGIESVLVGTGIDQNIFTPLPMSDRNPESYSDVMFHQRNHFLKGPETRMHVLQMLKGFPNVRTVGYAPWEGNNLADGFMWGPTDYTLASRMRQSLCFLVTSSHEGLCMPAAEAMCCGLPVVTTPADGNDFCVHGQNSLIGNTSHELVAHIVRLKNDPNLWLELSNGALKTATMFEWTPVIDRVEQVLA